MGPESPGGAETMRSLPIGSWRLQTLADVPTEFRRGGLVRSKNIQASSVSHHPV